MSLLACRDLTVRFGGLTALNKLSLSVDAGEILGLIGPNGSGKTTFFNALTALYPLVDGEVEFAGHPLTGHTPQQIYAAGITRTFQRSRLCLSLSVFDNLMIGNHRNLQRGFLFNLFQRRALAAQIGANIEAARALLRSFNAKLPERLFDAAGSLGMIDRRRVEVCRALISQPRLLLLDEPSAGMTHEETRELMDDILLVRETTPELAIILIEHEMGVIGRITQRCIVLNFGEKLCEGPYAQVAADPSVQQAYLGAD
ncbi:MAG: ABC transporter ATP-binding protein [Burkholderiales bacterium]